MLVIEALAMADRSVGWCAMIGCDSGYITAFLIQDVAREMYADMLAATGAAVTTTGEARRGQNAPSEPSLAEIRSDRASGRHCSHEVFRKQMLSYQAVFGGYELA
jgi:hypothetical protein